MTQLRDWDEEAAAANWMAERLGGRACRRDCGGSPPATHDYDIVVGDERVALEVTQHVDGAILAQHSLETKLSWCFDELSAYWAVGVFAPCDLREFNKGIVAALQGLEASRRCSWCDAAPTGDQAVDGSFRELGVAWVHRVKDASPGEVSITVASEDGPVSPEDIVSIVTDKAWLDDNLRKLGNADRSSRHLWIWIDAECYAAVGAMISSAHIGILPSTAPELPSEIDVVWVATASSSPIIWRLDRSGWSAAT